MKMVLRYRIVLADSYVMVRQGIKKVIESAADLEVVGETCDGLELLELVKRLSPDLVILDISMPRLRGLEAVHRIGGLEPKPKILFLSTHRSIDLVAAALSEGADGYLLKEDTDTELFCAIETIRQDRTYLTPALFSDISMSWAEEMQTTRRPTPNGVALTVRQREILKLTAEGQSAREIAKLLNVSPRTVEHHRANIMGKLKIHRAADLIRYAVEHGYVAMPFLIDQFMLQLYLL